MQRVIIVEDEIRSREFLQAVLQEHCSTLEVVATAGNVDDAVRAIRAHRPDLIFLDIELQTGTGFDVLAQTADVQPAVIFTTAYDHYAIKAIKFSAVDYLLKPIDVDELKAAVSRTQSLQEKESGQKTLNALMQNLKQLRTADNPTITLSVAEGLEFIPLSDIIHIEAAGAYTNFFLKGGKKLMVSKNLKEYENMLTDHDFMRVHNSHIINLAEVKRMVRSDGGYAVMSDDAQVIISPKKKEEFVEAMTSRIG